MVPSVDEHGAGDVLPLEDLAAASVRSDHLVEAADERTRSLLARRPGWRRRRVVPVALVLADLIGLSAAYAVATLLWGGDGALGSARELILFALSLPGWVAVAALLGLYGRDERRTENPTTDDIVGVFQLVTLGVWLFLVVSRLQPQRSGPGVLPLAGFWLCAVCLIPLARLLARETCERMSAYQQNTVIVGAGDVGQLIGRKLIKHPEYGANVVGFVDRFPKTRRVDLPEHLTILGGPERLPEIIEGLDVERVVIAFSREPASYLLPVLHRLRALNIQIDLVPGLFELVGPRLTVHTVEGLPLLGIPPIRRSSAALKVKRAIDLAGASLGLILFAPLMLYIAMRVRRDSPGPVLFRQARLGAGEKQFTSLKFRTMRVGTDAQIHREYIRRAMTGAAEPDGSGLYKLERPESVTRVGRWLRKTSLDELPQLINVLRGDMSLVGPRPCIPYERDHFAPHHLERFLMPQGLTGLWQVTARANSTYAEALDMDVVYVRGWSLWLDLRLLLRTPLQVIRQRSSTA